MAEKFETQTRAERLGFKNKAKKTTSKKNTVKNQKSLYHADFERREEEIISFVIDRLKYTYKVNNYNFLANKMSRKTLRTVVDFINEFSPYIYDDDNDIRVDVTVNQAIITKANNLIIAMSNDVESGADASIGFRVVGTWGDKESGEVYFVLENIVDCVKDELERLYYKEYHSKYGCDTDDRWYVC